MAKIVGGCLCGKIRYSCSEAPLMVAVCHCKNCQKQTGSTFSILVAVPKGTLHLEGEVAAYEVQGTTGKTVRRKFCGACGSPIVSEAGAFPTMDLLKAGTLDDTSWLKPDAQYWCDSAQAWYKLDSDLTQVAQNAPTA